MLLFQARSLAPAETRPWQDGDEHSEILRLDYDGKHLLYDVGERVAGRGLSPLPLLHPIW